MQINGKSFPDICDASREINEEAKKHIGFDECRVKEWKAFLETRQGSHAKSVHNRCILKTKLATDSNIREQLHQGSTFTLIHHVEGGTWPELIYRRPLPSLTGAAVQTNNALPSGQGTTPALNSQVQEASTVQPPAENVAENFSVQSVVRLYEAIQTKLPSNVKGAFSLFFNMKENDTRNVEEAFRAIGRLMGEESTSGPSEPN